ncbi:hypothetical protein JOQ06_002806, partial [Pogonophryne albipinna]
MSAGCALAPADRYSTKMASEGASGEQPPPVQTLATAVLGSVDTKCQRERSSRQVSGPSNLPESTNSLSDEHFQEKPGGSRIDYT